MARPRQFNNDQVVNAIELLFWEKGYEGTSYADLTQATRLGKGSLYAAYGNKKTLYIKALENYIAREVDGLGTALITQYRAAPELWRAHIGSFLNIAITAVSERADQRGCFLCNSAIDLAPFEPEVEAMVLAAFERIKQTLHLIIKDAVNIEKQPAMLEHLLTVYLGLRVMAKAGTSPARLCLARDMAMSTL